jgi:polyphenol oxidase
MLVIRPKIFEQFKEISCGISPGSTAESNAPYYFNLSFSVGDDPEQVKLNRKQFFQIFGLKYENVAFQNQIHTDNISLVSQGESCGSSDAMITSEKNLGLAVSTADCIPLFLYDPVEKIIAAVHSGWRSTALNISAKTVKRMSAEFNCRPENLFAYIGPSICANCYEVGKEFDKIFDSKYLTPSGDKYNLDLPLRNYDLLIESGVPHQQIEISDLCTFQRSDILHSYRRDGQVSGRAMGLIVMKDLNEN